MIATKIGLFCFPSAFWPLKIKMFSTFILYFFTQNCMIFIFYFIGKGQNVDINPSQRLWKLSVTKTATVFQSQLYPFKINPSLTVFAYSWAELNEDYIFFKKQAKKTIFAPKIALRVECSDPARNHQLCADFLNVRLQCS